MEKSHNRKRTPVRREFGINVRRLRYQREMTLENLSEMCDLHPTYIGSVERGERNISLENIVGIARGLRCSPKDLMPD